MSEQLDRKFIYGAGYRMLKKELLSDENRERWRLLLLDELSVLQKEISELKTEKSRNREQGFISGDKRKWASNDARITEELSICVKRISEVNSKLSDVKAVNKSKREEFFTKDKHLTAAIVLLETASMFIPKDMERWFEQLEALKCQIGIGETQNCGNAK